MDLLNKKKRRIRTVTRPAAKGLRIARQSRTSNAEPTPYDILCTKGDVPQRHNPPKGTFIIPEDIYSCFILDFVKEVAKFLAAKNQAQVNAFEICLKPTHPTKNFVIGVDLQCKITKNIEENKGLCLRVYYRNAVLGQKYEDIRCITIEKGHPFDGLNVSIPRSGMVCLALKKVDS